MGRSVFCVHLACRHERRATNNSSSPRKLTVAFALLLSTHMNQLVEEVFRFVGLERGCASGAVAPELPGGCAGRAGRGRSVGPGERPAPCSCIQRL